MISKTNQRLILNLDDIKVAAAAKLPTIARGEIEYALANLPVLLTTSATDRIL